MTNRWWIYQKERFPIVAHGSLVIIFCLAVLHFSSAQDGADWPGIIRVSGAVLSALLLFFQLRVADEFKDAEIDATYRPHRAVPRGLVSLRELASLASAGAVLQFLIAVSIDVGLVPLLVLTWAWIGLMTKEFFAPAWLVAHPPVYLLSHMLVMPLIAFYVSSFDWLCDCREMPAGLGWLLALSFCCGLVLELGRKIRVPASERPGVETYSGLWGVRTAVCLWFAALIASVVSYLNAAAYLPAGSLFTGIAGLVLLLGIVTAGRFPGIARRRDSTEKLIEPFSGLAALMLYAGLGPLQALLA